MAHKKKKKKITIYKIRPGALSQANTPPVTTPRIPSPKLWRQVNDLIKRMNRFGGSDSFCQKKGCFDTAYSTTMYISSLDIHYVEGYVDSLIPIVHAWNYFPEENIYFDLINDVAWDGEDSHFKSYYKIVTMDRNEVAKWSSITGYGGGFMESPQYIQSIIENE